MNRKQHTVNEKERVANTFDNRLINITKSLDISDRRYQIGVTLKTLN